MKSKQHRHNSYIFKTAKTALCTLQYFLLYILTAEILCAILLFSESLLLRLLNSYLINAPIEFRIRKVNPEAFDNFGNDSCL